MENPATDQEQRKHRQQRRLQKKVITEVVTSTIELSSNRESSLKAKNGNAPILEMLATQHQVCLRRRIKELGVDDVLDTEICSIMQGIGIASQKNKKLVVLSREINTRLVQASASCLLRLVSCTVTQKPPLLNGFSWLLGRLGDAEYSALRDNKLPLHDTEGYFAMTVVYEVGHGGDKEHVLGVAQLTRPSAAQTRWVALEWKLKMQLAEAMLNKLDNELVMRGERPALLFEEQESLAARLRRQHEEETMSMLQACDEEKNSMINGLLDKQTPKAIIQQASEELQRLKRVGSKATDQGMPGETSNASAVATSSASAVATSSASAAATSSASAVATLSASAAASALLEVSGDTVVMENGVLCAGGLRAMREDAYRVRATREKEVQEFEAELKGKLHHMTVSAVVAALEDDELISHPSGVLMTLNMLHQAFSRAPTDLAFARARYFVEKGVVGCVVRCMCAWPKECDLLSLSCKVLSAVILPDDACKESLLRVGGASVIINAMKAFPTDVELCGNAASALWNLSAGPRRCGTTIVNAGGIPVLQQATDTYTCGEHVRTNWAVVEACIATLNNLAEDSLTVCLRKIWRKW